MFFLKLILATIVFFFVWNILRRLFLSSPNKYKSSQQRENHLDKKIHWDAETVDYEEIPNDKTKQNEHTGHA